MEPLVKAGILMQAVPIALILSVGAYHLYKFIFHPDRKKD